MVDLILFSRTSRPYISRWVQSHTDLIVIGPIQQIQIEIILKVWGIDYFVRFLAHLPRLWLQWIGLAQRLTHILFVTLRLDLGFVSFPKTHDLVAEVGVPGLQDVLLQHFFVAGFRHLFLQQVALHLESTRTHLSGDKTVSKHLAIGVLVVSFHAISLLWFYY